MFKVNNISPKIGYYLTGFADGEGSLMIVIRNRPDFQAKYKISLCFNVSQKESYILSQFKKHLACGTLRSRPDGVWYFEVNNFKSIWENVIPFFDTFNFWSQNKRKQFSLFKQAAKIIKAEAHLTPQGFEQIIELRSQMNRGGKRKNLVSSETIRQTHLREDIVRPLVKTKEFDRNIQTT